MQYTMQVFEYEDNDQFRVIDRDGEPWFVLDEVCKKLSLVNTEVAANELDDDEKDSVSITDLMGVEYPTAVINESGLYSIVLRSNRPEAKRFKKWITSEVLPAIRKTGSYNGKVPAFIKRHNENWDKIEVGYFSVISELAVRLWGRLEMVGHRMADYAPDGKQIRPDVSVGRSFAKWLGEYHPNMSKDYKFYQHKTDEYTCDARQYPNSVLPLFIEFVDFVWIPKHSPRYLNTRDPAALPYLPKLLPKASS